MYIPLGGNRVGTLKAIRNIFIVWLLTGFWHGSAWNFVFWGIYYGVLLLLEKYVLKGLIARLPKCAGWLYTIFLVMIGWVFFFSSSLSGALNYIGVMFGHGASALVDNVGIYYLTTNLILFIIMAFSSTQKVYKTFMKFTIHGQNYRIGIAVVVYTVLFMICIAYLVNETYNPFLYFRF